MRVCETRFPLCGNGRCDLAHTSTDYGPFRGIRPRQLWAMVLFFSGISFAGYIAKIRRTKSGLSPCGHVSAGIVRLPKDVTWSFARASRSQLDAAAPLALGVVGASAVMCLRVWIATAVLNLPVSTALVPYLIAPFLAAAGTFFAWSGIRKYKGRDIGAEVRLIRFHIHFGAADHCFVSSSAVCCALERRAYWGETGSFYPPVFLA